MDFLDIIKFLIGISVLPSIVLMWMTYKKDKIEKEPFGMLVALFFCGGASIVVAGIVEVFFRKILGEFIAFDTSIIYIFIQNFIGVALVEELIKFVILKIGTWNNKNFNYTFDAIVYAVFVSLGFAAFENILYVLGNGVIVAILRAIISIPGHMTFGILMGIYYGRAKVCEKCQNQSGKTYNLILSLIVPVLLHGLFDFCLSVGSVLCIIIFIVVICGIYIILFSSIKKYSVEDTKIQNNNISFEEQFLEDDSIF